MMNDEDYMRMALSYARRGIGRAAPNPSVGCVIVKGGKVISRGRTHEGGRPHAEAEALDRAGALAKGATAYVTLEPCAVRGRDEPCSKKLIEAGVARVVVACIDPNPVVNGHGIELLKEAGIEVDLGVLKEKAQDMHHGFFLTHTQNRPQVTLKVALSRDGMIAALHGTRTQISGKLAQNYMHNLRSRNDGILVGSQTALIDKPKLTTRIEGYEHNIKRYVLDRSGNVKDCEHEIISGETSRDIPSVLKYIAEQGVTRLLVEGGAKLHQSFLESGHVDRFEIIRSHTVELGSAGVKAEYLETIHDYDLIRTSTKPLGDDTLEIYEKTK